jgi:DNA gyrase subunit A
MKVTGKNGEAVSLTTVSDKDEIMLMTEKGMIVRCPIKDIRTTGRSTQGVRLMRLDAADKVASVAKIVPEDESETAPAAAVVNAAMVTAAPVPVKEKLEEAKPETTPTEEKKTAPKEKVAPPKSEAKKKSIKRKK